MTSASASLDVAAVRARLAAAPLDALDLDEADRTLIEAGVTGLDDERAASVASAADALLARIGSVAEHGSDPFAGMADRPQDVPGLLPILALVATAGDVIAWLRARGLDAAAAASGVADLGQQLRVHRRATGVGGTDVAGWLATPWSGALLRHGALQVEHTRHARLGWVRSLHVPDGAALDRGAVDASLAASVVAGATAFPERATRIVHCDSWMLDPWLAEALPGTRLAAFASRFDLLADGGGEHGADDDGADDVLWFVWGRRPPWPDVVDLPRDTRLQAAVVERIAAGGRLARREGVLAR